MASANSSPPPPPNPGGGLGANQLLFVVNSLPQLGEDGLNERILETAEKLRTQPNATNLSVMHFTPSLPPPSPSSMETSSSPGETSASPRVNVIQCVFSRSHVAVLLDDYRICRFSYQVATDRLTTTTQSETSTSSNSKKCPYSTLTSSSRSSRSLVDPPTMSSRRRHRMFTASRGHGRSASSVIMSRSSHAMIPAQYVPEELVSQAQVVLQGKSRQVIIRELQRTNLDVNLAVNNLLSRDDEDFDDEGDSPDQLLPGEDLISLLDGGYDHSVIIDSEFAEEVLGSAASGYPLRLRGSSSSALFSTASTTGTTNSTPANTTGNSSTTTTTTTATTSGSTSTTSSTITSRRLREEAFSFLERDLQIAGGSSSRSRNQWYTSFSVSDGKESKSKKSSSSASSATQSASSQEQAPLSLVNFCGEQEFWPGSGDRKFVAIAALHSELVAVTQQGQLCQWKWTEPEPFKAQHTDGTVYYHPKVPSLGLLGEKVSHLASSCIRATVATESGKLATWLEDMIAPLTPKLEHSTTNSIFNDIISEGSSAPLKIAALYVSSLMTCVQLSTGALYWWGIPPFSHRKKMMEKCKSDRGKSSKSKSSGSSSSKSDSEITLGSLVCMKNSPIYHSGTMGFTTLGGIPKVGLLMNSAWKMTDSVTFRVLSQQEVSSKLQQQQVKNQKEETTNASSSATSGSKSTSLEMPPPPSPASSTSSSSDYYPIPPKRLKTSRVSMPSTVKEDPTETWNLKDVVFIEDIKNMPVGKVLKVDGNYVMVRFNEYRSSPSQADMNVMFENFIADCRLMRKDELVAIRSGGGTGSGKNYEQFQRFPKRVHVPEHVQILALALSNLGLHAIAKIGGYRFSYITINIVSGKIEQDVKISIENSTFFGIGKQSQIKLYTAGESENTNIVMCRDGNGTLYPLARDCTETVIREPISLNVGPVSTLSLGVFSLPSNISTTKTHMAILGLAFEPQILMTAILKSDLDQVREKLTLLERHPQAYHSMISELCDGNHNIIHIAVSSCFPTTNKVGTDTSTNSTTTISTVTIENVNDEEMPSMILDDNSSEASTQTESAVEPPLDPTEQKPIAHSILWTLLESPSLSRHLFDLLSARDFQGLTPFMLAVSGRAYSAANQLLVVIQKVAKQIASSNSEQETPQDATTRDELRQRALMQMLYPRGSLPDHSPLYMLCTNDTCSFTWTGEEHINQDIFECRTCGLVGSLCCCTECARVCHRGHDCKLKRTSPTAYCDCWEKCKCKALIAGCQSARYQLLKRLLSCTDLSQKVNSRGEHILLFLVQTVGRQIIEQKQYRPPRLRGFSHRSRNEQDESPAVPQHDLEPPKFARKALERLLGDWNCVKSMILTGYRAPETTTKRRLFMPGASFYNGTSNAYAYEEENAYLSRQNGSALLDKFTHSLLRIGLNDILDKLIETIMRGLRNPNPVAAAEAKLVTRRFIRSVSRVYLVVFFELNPSVYNSAYPPMSLITPLFIGGTHAERLLSTPNHIGSSSLSSSSSSSNSKKTTVLQILRKSRRVFLSFLQIALEELSEMAESLVAPVRLGLVRPSASFNLMNTVQDALTSSDDIFAVDTQIYSHQRDFLDSTFGLDLLEEPPPPPPPSQDPLSISMVWNSNDPPVVNNLPVPAERRSAEELPILEEAPEFEHGDESNPPQARPSSAPSAPPEIVIDPAIGDDIQPPSMGSPDPAMDQVLDMIHNGIEVNEVDDNSNVGGRDTESDSESNGDDASYLSNADNASAQRSVVTGATAGSDVGVASLPYDDESINSNPEDGEEEDEDEGEPEENEDEDEEVDDSSSTADSDAEADDANNLTGDQLDIRRRRRPGVNFGSMAPAVHRPHLATRNLLNHAQWALRRDTPGTNAVSSSTTQSDGSVSMNNSLVGLARSFSLILRHIADLLPVLRDQSREMNGLDMQYVPVNPSDVKALQQAVEDRLRSTWQWLINTMDANEAQLRFGCALSSRRVAPSVPGTTTTPPVTTTNSLSSSTRLRLIAMQDDLPIFLTRSGGSSRGGSVRIGSLSANRNSTTSGTTSGTTTAAGSNTNANTTSTTSTTTATDGISARRDFLSYAMSLLRSHSNEHYDSLPVMDVAALKHVAYIFDSFVYFIRRGILPDQPESVATDESMSEDGSYLASSSSREHHFFRRSNSTLFLGCPKPDPFSAPYHEALPLASKPHLLQPNSRREQLFGVPRPTNMTQAEEIIDSLPSQMSLTKRNSWNMPTSPVSTPQRSQSVITDPRSSIIQPLPSKPSVIVMAGSVKHQSTSQPQTNQCSVIKPPEKPSQPQYFGNVSQQDILLGRWRLGLELFGRLFVDDVGLEPHSIMTELSGFMVKELRFRREMERLKNGSTSASQRDLSFHKLDRDRSQLLLQSFKELNSVFGAFNRNRLTSQTALTTQSLAINRVKVTFKDEPGEGSGVARSFYTAFSEAVLANEKLPPLDQLPGVTPDRIVRSLGHGTSQSPFEAYQNFVSLRSHRNNSGGSGSSQNRNSSGASGAGSNSTSTSPATRPRSPGRVRLISSSRARLQLYDRIRPVSNSTSSASGAAGSSASNPSSPSPFASLNARIERALGRAPLLRYDAPGFVPSARLSPYVGESRHAIGHRIYNRAFTMYPTHAARITGMLVDIYPDITQIVNDEENFVFYLEHAMDIINIAEGRLDRLTTRSNPTDGAEVSGTSSSAPGTPSASERQSSGSSATVTLDHLLDNCISMSTSTKSPQVTIEVVDDTSAGDDNAPLFYQPGAKCFYSPRQGRGTELRLNAFRNVGRIIGVCFVQNELCPINFNRHVIKTILGKPVSWHDLAFFDSELYESLRQLILDAESSNKDDIFAELDFRFQIDALPEEGGLEVELLPSGRNMRVTPQNVYDYVRLYANYRMVESQSKAISAIRAGIFDVIPSSSFEGLTAEDFRLLLNGVNDINIATLQAYVTFYDESGDGSEPMSYFRKWFWWVVERMTNEEKQDLIYFWTGSPALPATEEGFQPQPSITIRPRDDYYFVTANTSTQTELHTTEEPMDN